MLLVCMASVPRAKACRLPRGGVPTVTASTSTAEVHGVVMVGVITCLHDERVHITELLTIIQMLVAKRNASLQ